jgi:predicted Zn-dependent peptidase
MSVVDLGAATGSVRRHTLPNGLTLLVRENHLAPVVALTVFLRAGSRYETVATNGITDLLGRVLLKGTRTRSALELAQAAEDAGGVIESGTDQEYAELRARGLARHWSTLLGILHEVVTAPSLPPAEVERERAVMLARIRGLEDQPFSVAARLLGRTMFGDHALGLPTAGEMESVTRLSREDLVRYLALHVTPGRLILSVSGAVAARDVVDEATERFAGLPAGPTEPPLAPPPTRPEQTRGHASRPFEQTHVLIGFLTPPIVHPDYPALRVLNTLLGHGMSSRLFHALRERAGLAYAVGSYYPTRRELSRLLVHIGTAPANAEAAERSIGVELARLREEPVGDDELARTKVYLTGSFDLDLRTNGHQSFYRGLYELTGVGHDWPERYREVIEAVTPADVLRVARRWLVEPAVAVVGPDAG